MDSAEVPQFFICPISLELMRDPVTTITGITYDRGSIERWLFAPPGASTCPVTQLPLPRDHSALTPNLTLRRLIQAWSESNAGGGVERIPTPRAPVDRPAVHRLLRDLSAGAQRRESLELIAALARESESNRRCILQSGAAAALVEVVATASPADEDQLELVEVALRVFHSLRAPAGELKPVVDGGGRRVLDAMTRVLQLGGRDRDEMRSTAAMILKSMVEVANPAVLEQLAPEFLGAVLGVVRGRVSQQATRAAMKVLMQACAWGKNRGEIVAAGGVREALELELMAPERRTTELNLALLGQLCMTGEGRAELVGHPAGIAAVAKRILRVSAAADELGMQVLTLVCRSATREVVEEMVSVGAVAKLCLVMQASCSSSVKEKARSILRLHWQAWKDAPCVDSYLQSRYP